MTILTELEHPSEKNPFWTVSCQRFRVSCNNEDEAYIVQWVMSNDYSKSTCLTALNMLRANKTMKPFIAYWPKLNQVYRDHQQPEPRIDVAYRAFASGESPESYYSLKHPYSTPAIR